MPSLSISGTFDYLSMILAMANLYSDVTFLGSRWLASKSCGVSTDLLLRCLILIPRNPLVRERNIRRPHNRPTPDARFIPLIPFTFTASIAGEIEFLASPECTSHGSDFPELWGELSLWLVQRMTILALIAQGLSIQPASDFVTWLGRKISPDLSRHAGCNLV